MLSRWWIYQQERFPIFKNGLLIAVFSSSAVSYSALLRGEKLATTVSMLVAFNSVFLFFLQLRIADEFKDFEDDAQYRPYRPVPRGLVSLRELGNLGICTGIIQLGLALWLVPKLVLLLGFVWLYFGLMCREFFAHHWLKAHPLAYMGSHMVIVPLINFYATACDWAVANARPPVGIAWFLLASFFNGIVIEIGRKIRAPEGEEFGVETYSALWGRRNAVLAWLLAMALTAIAALLAASQLKLATLVSWLLGIVLMVAAGSSWLFLRRPQLKKAKLIEAISALWTLTVYLCLGILPLFLQK